VPTEKVLPERLLDAPGPSADEFAVPRTGRIEVIHGVYAHSLPLAGMTVRQARSELEDRMNIDPESTAVIDGKEAAEEELLREGQVLNFLTPAGEKG
jgi:hypothetical protein